MVDDIFTNRLLLGEIFREIGCEIEDAENGKAALEAIHKIDFDIVFMDIEMPVMNGLETTIYIRENLPEPKNKIPVVALTAHNPQMFFDDFKEAGFTSLLTKPFSIDKILNLIKEVLPEKFQKE